MTPVRLGFAYLVPCTAHRAKCDHSKLTHVNSDTALWVSGAHVQEEDAALKEVEKLGFFVSMCPEQVWQLDKVGLGTKHKDCFVFMTA